MDIKGSVALVTGANRGIGRALAADLVNRGAKVYGSARDVTTVTDPGVIPVRLDITDPAQVAAAAATCGDVTILINNAGISTDTTLLTAPLSAAREEIEVNYLGTLAMARAFSPVLGTNGGGALVNVLSVLSWYSAVEHGTYAAAKAASWSATNGLRVSLREQGTLVTAVHCGYVDTDMSRDVKSPKLPVATIVAAIADGIETDQEEVLVDPFSRHVRSSLSGDLRLLYAV
jgi:NAD(P)-dependent dehydrogenase (short-subunit alcohol dehydrogenase family)